MVDFIKLCKIIVDKNGAITVKDVLECGYDLEHFARITQKTTKADKLVKNAKQALLDRGIYYKGNS
jgi:hypothetical protein